MNPRPQTDLAAAVGRDGPGPASEPAEIARELDQLRVASRENRAFIRATRRELRKPLNALAGILRDLSAQLADREAGMALRTALQWTMSLGHLTNDLLELAVLQADEAEEGALEFDVRDTVEEVAHATRLPNAGGSPLTVEVRPEVPSMLMGHPNRIRQILTAGAHHIIATRGARSLHLGLVRLSETQTHVDLLFGVHHSDAIAPPLDEKSMANSIEADFSYLVAQRMARGLGGTLELLDGGDAVHLRIKLRKSSAPKAAVDASRAAAASAEPSAPAADPARTTAAPPAPEPPAEAAAAAPAEPAPAPAPVIADVPEITLKGTRVLLTGSSGPSAVALQIELRALGCESESVVTVDDAIRKLLDSSRRMRPFHICVADFSGVEDVAEQLVARVRAEEELRNLQMLLLVELGSKGDAEWAEQLGFGAYMTKPIQSDDLGAVFKELMQRSVAVDPNAVRLITRHSVRETRRRRLHCLVVDDDNVNLIALKAVIERLGHAVETASTGTEAFDLTAQQHYDLILSDVRLPDVDGDQVAVQVLARQVERGERPTPIFAMSANSLPGDSQRCRAAGMRNYFLKPLTLPLLTQLLRYALENAAEVASDAPPAAAAPAPAPAAETKSDAPVPQQEIQVSDRTPGYDEASPIDLDHLEMASVGVPELRRKMLSTFLVEMDAGMHRLGDFIADGNHGGAAMMASALNSTCASIGALDCAHHLSEMERRAAAGDLASLDTLHAESLAQWDRVKDFAAKLLEETPGQSG